MVGKEELEAGDRAGTGGVMLTLARPGPFSLAIGDCNEPHQQQDPDAPKEPEGRKEEIDRDQGEKTPGNKGHAAASVRINCPSRRRPWQR